MRSAALGPVATWLIRCGVTADTVTLVSLALALGAAVLLGTGHFGPAAAAMIVSSLGDALDGLMARRSGSASVPGALLDASADRYGELFFLGGIAVWFHDSVAILALTLAAIAGSFMVSYGSAKAEAIGVPVPPGVMRRAERAACLCTGVLLASMLGDGAIVVAVALVAVVGNVSAIRRLVKLARISCVPSAAGGAIIRHARPMDLPVRRAGRAPVREVRKQLERQRVRPGG
ncbi:MAG TPA: CDP-alcohol phosphatidyltransferase family protein [Polyangiaceae bacterium]